MYCVDAVSPVSEYVIDVIPVFATKVDNGPAPVARSILYPVIADPPSAGAVQLKSICDEDIVVATSPVGVDGTVLNVFGDVPQSGDKSSKALFVSLVCPVPSEFIE